MNKEGNELNLEFERQDDKFMAKKSSFNDPNYYI